MKKVLGLDIGISSVGWGVIDQESGSIMDAGVRLFEEADRNANEFRRSTRGARRLKRRRSHRLERTKGLFKHYNFPVSGIGHTDPYEARYNAIYYSVSKDELAAGLYHLVKMRGTVLDSPEDDNDSDDNSLSTKDQISNNKKLLSDKFVCEIQLNRMNEEGHIRGHKNRFRTGDYVTEAKAILNNQQGVHKEITDQFKKDFIGLIESRRAYYEGPGSKQSPTPYGRYFINDNGELDYESMINKMRGRCTYFPDELRIAKMSFTSDLFNLLSGDLNKLQIDGDYLTYEDKLFLINKFIKKGKNITLKQILKYKEASNDADVSGYRVDLKNDKPLFTEFEGYKKMKKIVETNHLPSDILDDIDLMDEIAEILTAEKAYDRREEQLNEVFARYNDDTRISMVDAFKEATGFSGYHALSKKAMMTIMSDLWQTNKNQMELFSELGLEEKRLTDIKNKNDIKFDDTAILSTVAKRAHREAIKIVNTVRSKYGELDSIVVETARDKNSDEQKKKQREFQKNAGKHEKEMAKLLGVDSLAELKLNSKQNLMLRLLSSQDWQCIYSGKAITANDVVENPHAYEVDHIVPVSLSFDDSQSNKVVCAVDENQKKGQKTPFQYFNSGRAVRSFDQYKANVIGLHKGRKINNKKKDYLLEMRDIKFNEDLQREFINRNLVDTQYAMRSFSMNLRSFYKAHNVDTTVLSIRGSFTAALRRQARINKMRDDGHAHHAIDALIVAAVGRMPIFKFFRQFDMNETGVVFNKETGEIPPDDDIFANKFITFLRSLTNYESMVKYSHKVDRKVNRSMSDQTIYSTREKEGEKYVVGKFKKIYDMSKDQVKPLLNKLHKQPEVFFIAQYNPELMELVQKITNEYKDFDNPFRGYYDDHGYIKKDGKVPVKSLKYYEQKLGVHMDITDKYPGSKNQVVLRSIKSVRIDLYENPDGKYKYMGVPYHWFKKDGNRYILDMAKYYEEKKQMYKKIDDSYEFKFSLYKNDLFSFYKDGKYHERIFRGDNNPRKNRIEVDFVDRKKESQGEGIVYPSSFNHITKYNVDILGQKYQTGKEKFKDSLQM